MGRAFGGALIHNGQEVKLTAICGGVEEEVIRPHHVELEQLEGAWPASGNELERALLMHQQPSLSPAAVRARPTELKAWAMKKDADSPVPIAGLLGRQRLHNLDDHRVIGRQLHHIAQRGSGNPDQPASPALGQAFLAIQFDRFTPVLRAHHFLHRFP